jgi:hypothetical protein
MKKNYKIKGQRFALKDSNLCRFVSFLNEHYTKPIREIYTEFTKRDIRIFDSFSFYNVGHWMYLYKGKDTDYKLVAEVLEYNIDAFVNAFLVIDLSSVTFSYKNMQETFIAGGREFLHVTRIPSDSVYAKYYVNSSGTKYLYPDVRGCKNEN